jgi:hypothetical protein
MINLRTLDWGLQTSILKEIGSGSRGSEKKSGPFPKRAAKARVRLIPVMTHVNGPGLSLKRLEKNQNQVAGKRAKPA